MLQGPRSPSAHTPVSWARHAGKKELSAYEKKVARAKSGKKLLDAAPEADGRKFSLDLSTIPKAPVEGDHKLGDGKEATTMRTPPPPTMPMTMMTTTRTTGGGNG